MCDNPEAFVYAATDGTYSDGFQSGRPRSLSDMLLHRTASLVTSVSHLKFSPFKKGEQSFTDKLKPLTSRRKSSSLADADKIDVKTAASVGTSGKLDLLEKISIAFKDQRHNGTSLSYAGKQADSNHGKLNFWILLAVFVKYKKMEIALQCGQRVISQMESHLKERDKRIEELNNRLGLLSVDAEHHERVSQRLRSILQSQEQQFMKVTLAHGEELDKQLHMLAKQQNMIDSLLRERSLQDSLVNTSILAATLLVVNWLLVWYPKKVLFSNQIKWLLQFTKMIILVQLFFNFKKILTSSEPFIHLYRWSFENLQKHLKMIALKTGLLGDLSKSSNQAVNSIC